MAERLARAPSSVGGSFDFRPLQLAAGWSLHVGPGVDTFAVWNERRTAFLAIAGDEFAAGTLSASTALRTYEIEGARCLEGLNGWFCGFLVDLTRGQALLFNDRYGLGRIYVDESPDGTLRFATEAKSLLAVNPQLRQLDLRGVAEFVALGCVLQDRTLFRGVQLLPPASIWTIHGSGRIEKRRYFSPEKWEQQSALDAPAYDDALRDVFARAARRVLTAAQPIGMSLTGGLDSRAVIAWARAEPGTLPCYTFGGPYRDCADVRIARQLARRCGQPHTTIRIGDDFFANFATLVERTIHVSDGAMDVTGAVELHVNRFASGIAPVRVTGNYGSEIVRSNLALRPSHLDRGCFTPEFCTLLDEAIQTYHLEVRSHPLTFIAFKQIPWHHFARFSVERSEVCPRSPFLDNDLIALAYRAPRTLRGSARPMLELITSGNPGLARIGTDRALRARRPQLVNRFATQWQELTVKAEYAYDYGMPQWLVRTDRLLAPLRMERLFLGRHKFYHFRVWYRDQLQGYVRDHVTHGSNIPAGFDAAAAKRLATEHLAGTANHTLALHKLLSLQLVESVLLRQQ